MVARLRKPSDLARKRDKLSHGGRNMEWGVFILAHVILLLAIIFCELSAVSKNICSTMYDEYEYKLSDLVRMKIVGGS